MPDSYRLKPHDGLPWRKREPPGTDPVRHKRRAGPLANTLSGEEVKPPPRAANFYPFSDADAISRRDRATTASSAPPLAACNEQRTPPCLTAPRHGRLD